MKKTSIIIGIILLISFLAFLTYERKIEFDKYSTVKILNPNYNFGNKKVGDKVYHQFIIKNISNQPFTITNIYSEAKINFLNTRIKKIVDTQQDAIIETELTLTQKGQVNELIQVESNSDKGIINLKIEGNVK